MRLRTARLSKALESLKKQRLGGIMYTSMEQKNRADTFEQFGILQGQVTWLSEEIGIYYDQLTNSTPGQPNYFEGEYSEEEHRRIEAAIGDMQNAAVLLDGALSVLIPGRKPEYPCATMVAGQ